MIIFALKPDFCPAGGLNEKHAHGRVFRLNRLPDKNQV